jgi:hypothetical protein
MIDTGTSGRDDVRLEVGAPARVTLQVVEDLSGRLVADAELRWHCQWPEGITFGSFGDTDWNPETQSYLLVAPAGGIDLHLGGRDYVMQGDGLLQVHPGDNALTLRVTRACGVLLTLVDGATRVSWEDEVQVGVQVIEIDGAGQSYFSGWEDQACYWIVHAPGRYEIRIPEVAGFEPIDPFVVDIPAAEFVKHTVILERR